jgi:hypothetical protein
MANDPAAAEALKDLEENSGNDSGSNDNSSTNGTTGGKGIVGFIKANPVPTVIGGGLLAYGIYSMVKPKKKKTDNLAGYREKQNALKGARGKTKSKQINRLPIKAVKLL